MKPINTIFILTVITALSACSPSDKGKKFSEGSGAAQTAATSTASNTCPFEGVSFNADQSYTEDLKNDMTSLFKKHIKADTKTGHHLVKYFDWRKNKRNIVKLCNIMSGIKNADISNFSNNEKTAFYINAYNVFAFSIAISNYEALLDFNNRPLRSIQNINSLGESVLTSFQFEIAGQTKNLVQLENELLKQAVSPLFIFALSCAAKGCPSPSIEPYEGSTIEEKLLQKAKAYINNRTNVSIDFYGKSDSGNSEGGELLLPSFLQSRSSYFNNRNLPFSNSLGAVVYFLDQEQLSKDGLDFKKEELLSNDDELWFIDENTFNWSINEFI